MRGKDTNQLYLCHALKYVLIWFSKRSMQNITLLANTVYHFYTFYLRYLNCILNFYLIIKLIGDYPNLGIEVDIGLLKLVGQKTFL